MTAFHLLLIDAQNDFCDLPGEAGARPALPVPGADADLRRVAALVRRAGHAIDAITLTLDTHHRLDIAHPGWWRTGEGGEVAPFTAITAADVRAGRVRPRREGEAARAQALAYLDALEAGGRHALRVWPVHGEIGTWGHQLHAEVREACAAWELARLRTTDLVIKGLNPRTEHYSALQAEVPDPDDPATGLDRALLARLDAADRLIVAGEAGSHCVRATVEHLVENLPDRRPARLGRLVLLTDAMSPVPGFEAVQADFLARMRGLGVRLATCEAVAAEIETDTAAGARP